MKQILTIMAALSCGAALAQGPASDVIKTDDGDLLKINFFGHGSVGFEFFGGHVYVDPVSEYADYATLPKADAIVVTHDHGDHLDPTAIAALTRKDTHVVGNGSAIEKLGSGKVLAHGESYLVNGAANNGDGWECVVIVDIEAVPACNTSPEKLNFHPRERAHNGYVLTFGKTRVYVAGDTEPTPEMLALRDIDIAFLPVNLPYTMTEEQAAEAVRAIRPRIFYPYHYGGTDHKTDLGKLRRLIDGTGVEMRVRPLE